LPIRRDPLSQRRAAHKPAASAGPRFVVKHVFTISIYHERREVGDFDMIGLIALLNVSQPLPWLDRSWINHQARREMLVAASASRFDPAPRVHAAIPVRLLPASFARGPQHAGIGGPSGM
jgi:hypothetical protein